MSVTVVGVVKEKVVWDSVVAVTVVIVVRVDSV